MRSDCRFRFFGLLALLACVVASPDAMAVQSVAATHRVRLYWTETYDSIGYVDIDLFGEASPRHVANFLRYVDHGVYDNSYIHRTQSGDARFLQGGSFKYPDPFSINELDDPQNYITNLFGTIKNEFDASNGLSNISRSLAAARPAGGIDTASVGWFINVTDNSAAFDPGVYTVFGEVTAGWDAFADLVNRPIIAQAQPSMASRPFATAPLLPAANGNHFVPVLLEWTRVPLIAGDFNLDGIVDAADELVWQASQGAFGEANLVADANGDGVVDLADRAIWQQNLGMGQLNNLPGDYNGNGEVTLADYLWWTTHFGADDIFDADGNGDGIVDAADYTIWRNAYAAAGGVFFPPDGVNVPEPATCLSLAVALMAIGYARRKRT